jgi:hypothetical protein
MARTVTIHIENDFIQNSSKVNAIGCLASWAMPSFDKVDIYRDGREQDMIAHYLNTTTNRGYTIGAIYDKSDNSYSFHS